MINVTFSDCLSGCLKAAAYYAKKYNNELLFRSDKYVKIYTDFFN